MPEGPEIRRAADRIAAILQDQIIETVWFGLPTLKPFERKLTGARLIEVETRGKAMLNHFDNGLSIYSHNQLYGRWYCLDKNEMPDTSRQLRLRLETASKTALLFSASDIAVLTKAGLKTHPLLSRLGADILSSSLDGEAIAERLLGKGFRNRQLATLLTDQSFLAGLGNYLRCEILFTASLHPRIKPSQCTDMQLERLADAIVKLPRQSYETGGITNQLTLAEQLISEGSRFESVRFKVFRREGLPCYRCGTKIIKIISGSQGCFLCPECQHG
ncbi:MAG: endonuclease VIII [gamma proteobacterium endosymbiont of Lamellibrachia anaximandri]|nr:endonuclease VIII [gamma proteobacterium endosymbiont of Lamellibrachia anaximandri]